MIRRYHNAFDYDGSDWNYDLCSIRLRYDYDEKLTSSFFAYVESHRMEVGTRDTSLSYRSQIAIVITALETVKVVPYWHERWSRSWCQSVGRPSAGDLVINLAVSCRYLLLWLPSQLQSTTILWPVPNYTARWQGHTAHLCTTAGVPAGLSRISGLTFC